MELIENFITLPNLCHRWQCDFELIQPYTENQLNHRGFPDLPPKLQAYKINSIRECAKGTVKACVASPIYLNMRSFEPSLNSWDGEVDASLLQSEVVFDMKEVLTLEREKPVLLCASVPFDPNIESMDTTNEQISKLCGQVSELKAQVSDLQAKLAEAEARAADAQKALADAPKEVVTVNAELWGDSMAAACAVLVEIVESGETGVVREAFNARMKAASRIKMTHTKSDMIAWKALPERHKSGPGAPLKEKP